MALTEGNGGLSAADIAAITGNRNSGFGFGNDGAWWIIILFLFGCFGGWGNGFGNMGGGGMLPFMMGNQQGSEVQRVVDQQSVMNGITGLNGVISNGFANAEISRCNAQTNVLQALNTNQAATVQGMNTLAMSLQQCCCDNRSATADLKYTVATEACADRNAISNALRDVIASNTANTQAILDKLCQQELEALKTQNANLQTQLNMANLAASQTAQTARILQDNAAQTAALENYLNPPARPAYVVQNPNCCAQQWAGYGCNS